jgi:ribose-phosphate pyrophosphokinase
LVANFIETAGANHVITMDLHAPQIQCFFNIPLDNMRAEKLLIAAIRQIFPDLTGAVLVTPDAGGAKR